MARGACGCVKIILTSHPFRSIHVEFVLESPVQDPMLGLLIDFPLRMVRAQVTFAADFGFPRLFLAEPVPGVTG
jgi:hypothetical protein